MQKQERVTFFSHARTIAQKPIHYLKQKKIYIYINRLCCSRIWDVKQLCAIRTAKQRLTEQKKLCTPVHFTVNVMKQTTVGIQK